MWICTTWISNSTLCTWRTQCLRPVAIRILQAVRAAVAPEELLYVRDDSAKAVGAYSDMLEKTEEGNPHRLKSESTIDV